MITFEPLITILEFDLRVPGENKLTGQIQLSVDTNEVFNASTSVRSHVEFLFLVMKSLGIIPASEG